MRLEIYLNQDCNKEDFIKLVYACIERGYDLNNSEIETWDLFEFTNFRQEKENGFRHYNTQFAENGWITLRSGLSAVISVVRKSAKYPPESDEEAIMLFRFASMLQRHFSDYIRTISLTGI